MTAVLLVAAIVGGWAATRDESHPIESVMPSSATSPDPFTKDANGDLPNGPDLTEAQAKAALATVLRAEQAYFEAHGKYTEEHSSDDEHLTGVDAGAVTTEYGQYPTRTGVVMVWLGFSSDEIKGALYLGIKSEAGHCFYARAEDADNAKVRTTEDNSCPLSGDASYPGQEWKLPSE
jgi:hypothetical protein